MYCSRLFQPVRQRQEDGNQTQLIRCHRSCAASCMDATSLTLTFSLTVEPIIIYRLSVLISYWQHGQTPTYLSDGFQYITDMDSRQWLKSASTTSLHVPATKCVTIGDHSLPLLRSPGTSITSSPSLPI